MNDSKKIHRIPVLTFQVSWWSFQFQDHWTSSRGLYFQELLVYCLSVLVPPWLCCSSLTWINVIIVDSWNWAWNLPSTLLGNQPDLGDRISVRGVTISEGDDRLQKRLGPISSRAEQRWLTFVDSRGNARINVLPQNRRLTIVNESIINT